MKLLELPVEVVYMVIEWVIKLPVPHPVYPLTFLYRAIDHNSIIAVSQTNRFFRRICLDLCVIRYLSPIAPTSTRIEACTCSLTALGVNPGDPLVWDGCGQILKQLPTIKELIFNGLITRDTDINAYNSNLVLGFRRFKGSTLTFKDTYIDELAFRLLVELNTQTITFINFDHCEFAMLHYYLPTPYKYQLPLCPNAEAISFIHKAHQESYFKHYVRSLECIIEFFIQGTKHIKHVAAEYGLKPRLTEQLPESYLTQVEYELPENRDYECVRLAWLAGLGRNAGSSLISYTEYDGLQGPFMEDLPPLDGEFA
jgi:hypothetical protein